MVDTTVRGFVYEAVGTVGPAVLSEGRRLSAEAARTWSIPVRVLEAEPADHTSWTDAAVSAVGSLLDARQQVDSPRRKADKPDRD